MAGGVETVNGAKGQVPTPLGILAAGGRLPLDIAHCVLRTGRTVELVLLDGLCDPDTALPDVATLGTHRVALGRIGEILAKLRQAGCMEVILAGHARRPDLKKLRLDAKGMATLPRFLPLLRGGDDHLLTGIIGFLEDEGFAVVGVKDVTPGLLMSLGPAGRHRPDEQALRDIALGEAVIAGVSPHDVGQAVVVNDNRVLAIEAAEGTDAMLERVTALRQRGSLRGAEAGGVLVKRPKIGQDERVDLPTIGARTLENVAVAGLQGVAVTAGEVILLERESAIDIADRAKLFLYGIDAPAASGKAPKSDA